MPKLTIDGHEVEVDPGTSVLQAAEKLGVEIPRFCYHDRLSVPANCRMCLVEIEGGPPKPAASCAMACAEGMVVKTNSDMVHRARKGVMEFLLINHPLDCPICDQGGECDLQDQAVGYGYDRSRYAENKRAVPNKELGPLIKTVMTRCIQCTRCVRFGDEIAGVSELGLLHRGEDVEIGTFVEKAVSNELSGNMIDVCPVGALTSKPYAFVARPWELIKTETIDVHDAVGSNIRVDVRGREVMRVLPALHEDVNEEWISDKTRFATDGLKKARLDRPWIRDAKTKKLEPASWEEAILAVAKKLTAVKPEKIAALAGPLADLESMTALKDLMTGLGVKNLECRSEGEEFDASVRAGYIFNSGIAGIEEADAILLVGTNPRKEAAIINARIRKTWLANRTKIAMVGEECELTYPYEYLGAGPKDLEDLMSARSGFAKILKDAKRPMVIVGAGVFDRKDGKAVQGLLFELAEKFKLVKKKDGWNGFNVLQHHASRVGALDIGFTAAKAFALKDMSVIYALGADHIDWKAVTKKPFVIYQGHHGDAGAARADVVLPGGTYTEKDGLYVNTEGRVQQAFRANDMPGEAREDWKILRALSEPCGEALPYDNILQLRERIESEWPHLGEVDELVAADWKAFGAKSKPQRAGFVSPIENFYMTNVICNASETMRKCTESFVLPQLQAKAAE